MIKNLIFDIGGVLTEEVNCHALTHLSVSEREQLSSIFYYKSPGFLEALLGNKTSADYSAELVATYPNYEKEIRYLFNPENLSTTYPIKQQTLNLLHKLHNSYKIYFLSDITDISYNYVKNTLDAFDGGAYSFQEHIKKPNLEFFKILLNRYSLDPTETFFFDDREKNVAAAKQLNIQSVIFVDINSVTDALGS